MVAALESPLVLLRGLHGTFVVALLALVAQLACAAAGQAPAVLAGVPIDVTLAVAAAALARRPSARARAFVVATSVVAMVENVAWTLAVLYLLGLFHLPGGDPNESAMWSQMDGGLLALFLCPRAVWSPVKLLTLGRTVAACRSRETRKWLASTPKSF